MEYKVGETFDTLPESIARLSGGANRAVFLVENYAEKLTAEPNKWVVLDTLDDLNKSKLYTCVTNYNKKYNSKGFEFARIVTETNQIFLGRYNPDLLA